MEAAQNCKDGENLHDPQKPQNTSGSVVIQCGSHKLEYVSFWSDHAFTWYGNVVGVSIGVGGSLCVQFNVAKLRTLAGGYLHERAYRWHAGA